MDEFLCVQVLSNAGETDDDFSTRLEDFWDLAHYSLAAALYAYGARLEDIENRRARSYLVYRDQARRIEQELDKAGFDVIPADEAVLVAGYEAVQPDWVIIDRRTDAAPPTE